MAGGPLRPTPRPQPAYLSFGVIRFPRPPASSSAARRGCTSPAAVALRSPGATANAPSGAPSHRLHDDQANLPVLEPALELRWRHPVSLDNLPSVISNADLEYTLDLINSHTGGPDRHPSPSR